MEIKVDNNLDDIFTFRKMIINEWGSFDLFGIENNGMKAPFPILAKEKTEIVGGLAFIWYQKPDKESIGLWVNALYVIPEQRNKGIGSSLLNTAKKKIELGFGLYALTDIPDLYINCGWSILSKVSTNYVLKYKKFSHNIGCS